MIARLSPLSVRPRNGRRWPALPSGIVAGPGAEFIALNNGLENYWPLAGGIGIGPFYTLLTDLGPDNYILGSNPGVTADAASWGIVEVGCALFNGTTSRFIRNGLLARFSDNGNFTWSKWVWLDSVLTSQTIFSVQFSGVDYQYLRYVSGVGWQFAINKGGQLRTVAGGVASAGGWIHVLCYFDSVRQKAGMEINSVAQAEVDAPGLWPASTPQTLQFGARLAASFMAGRLFQVGRWSRLLNATEKSWIYNHTKDYPWPHPYSIGKTPPGVPDDPINLA